MQAFGMLLLAAATAGDGFGYQAPGVGLKKWLRPHVVATSDATGAPPYTAAVPGRRRRAARQAAGGSPAPRARSTSSTPTACRSAGRPPAPTANASIRPPSSSCRPATTSTRATSTG